MDRPHAIYRTTDKDTVAAIQAAFGARNQWSEEVERWAKRAARRLKLSKPTKRRAVVRDGFSTNLIGIEFKHGDEIPEGWRIERKADSVSTIVPRLSTKTGKAAQEEISAFGNKPDPRDVLREHGMPSRTAFFGRPGLSILDGGTTAYVVWGSPPGAIDGVPSEPDERWEKIATSVFYAAVEKDEAEEATNDSE